MSSPPSSPPPELPVGDLRLYDHYLPSIEAGNWYLSLDHTVLDGTTVVNQNASQQPIPMAATQEFVVTAPQFAMDTTELLAMYPPASSTGQYAEELPHVVLSEPMLPWERLLSTGTVGQPWLALLVLDAEEIVGAPSTGSATGSVSTTVGDFLAPGDGTVLKPSVTPEADVATTDPMMMVQVATAAFAAAAPHLDEITYLTHCRQANTVDKATFGINEHGLFSVVVANRFPQPPATGSTTPVKSVVHLVSLEGLEAYLVEGAQFGTATSVALASLASWSFWTLSDPQEDFQGLMDAIVAEGEDPATGVAAPDQYRLRLGSGTVDPLAVGGAEAIARLDQGFVPLSYVTRSAESTMGWYRGPLTPYPVTSLVRSEPFLTADAALSYQPAVGLFDASLAAAFQVGRAAALSDSVFGQRLLDVRTRGHRFTDALLYRLQSDAFSATDIAGLSGATVQDELRAILKFDLLTDLGQGPTPITPPATPVGPDTTPAEALAAFLAQPDVQAALIDAVAVDLDPIATWLGQLLLLVPVPFHALVPVEAMLPTESLRFFSVDPNWQRALVDGALSIGIESSRDTFFQQIIGDVLETAAFDALETYRSTVSGSGPAPPAEGAAPITGLVLRSAVVTGWPNLVVQGTDAQGGPVKTLRMDHLSPSVLLVLFSGAPTQVTIAEPQEGFRFGVNDDGQAALRSLLVAAGLQVGEQFPVPQGSPELAVPVLDPSGAKAESMRAAGSRVLNITPSDPNGLVQTLTGGLTAASAPATIGTLGPADLALQMIRAPEAVHFNAPQGG